jgi:hypothetical protein
LSAEDPGVGKEDGIMVAITTIVVMIAVAGIITGITGE